MKVVIVGGVAGGATAAARIRRLDEDAQVIVLERSGYVSYANCGLPKLLWRLQRQFFFVADYTANIIRKAAVCI